MPRTTGAPNIQPKVKSAIIQVKRHNPRFPRKEVRKFLLGDLKTYDLFKDEVPLERSIQKIIHETEHTKEGLAIMGQLDRLSRPWHLGLMREYKDEITPEAVPTILAAQRLLDQRNMDMHAAVSDRLDELNSSGKEGEWEVDDAELERLESKLTVGQAIWISRLHKLATSTEEEEIERLGGIRIHYYLKEVTSIVSKKRVRYRGK